MNQRAQELHLDDAGPGTAAVVERLLPKRPLGGRNDLEPFVGNRLPTVDRQPVGSGREPRFCPFERRQLIREILGGAGVELVLIQPLRSQLTGLALVGQRLRLVSIQGCERLLDPPSFSGEKFSCTIDVHVYTVSGLGAP
jgi:hypothetical protein